MEQQVGEEQVSQLRSGSQQIAYAKAELGVLKEQLEVQRKQRLERQIALVQSNKNLTDDEKHSLIRKLEVEYAFDIEDLKSTIAGKEVDLEKLKQQNKSILAQKIDQLKVD